jgi:hypothetical protein
MANRTREPGTSTQLVEDLTIDGASPFRDWFDDHDSRAAAKVTVALIPMGMGKALLRDYFNTTESVAEIPRELESNEKSLRRMLGPKGNPTLKNFLSLLKMCRSAESLTLQVCHH